MPGLVEITQWFWFIDCLLFLSPLRIFHSEKDVKIAGEVLQNLGRCSTFMPFWAANLRYKILPINQTISRCIPAMRHVTSFYTVLSEGTSRLVAPYNKPGGMPNENLQTGGRQKWSERLLQFKLWCVFFFLLKSAISLAIIIIHIVGAAAVALWVRAFAPQA